MLGRSYLSMVFVISCCILSLSGCMTVSGNQNIVPATSSGANFSGKKISVLPVKAQTSLAPDSVLALRAEINKLLGTTLKNKLKSSHIIDVGEVADRLNQANSLQVFEQIIATYENTGVIDKRNVSGLGHSLGCNYLLLTRLKAEKMDFSILGKGSGASLEAMLINVNSGETDWAGSGEWKRGGLLGTGGSAPSEMAQNIINLTFESLQASGDAAQAAPDVNQSNIPPQDASVSGAADKAGSNKQIISQAQKQLLVLGYDIGKPDGKIGGNTMKALKQFQQENNLAITGQIDTATTAALKRKVKELNL